MSVYDFKVKNIKGQEVSLSEYKGKVLLIVNVASKCGFTPQYKGLEELYQKYKPKNFVILGFPCNQFGEQEPGDEAEIQNFCQLNFGVTFPLFQKIDVNGDNADPLYKYLTNEKRGVLMSKAVKWNFTKFLIDSQGKPVERYAPTTKPEDLGSDIEKLLT
jgi:glutathione peroxidase